MTYDLAFGSDIVVCFLIFRAVNGFIVLEISLEMGELYCV